MLSILTPILLIMNLFKLLGIKKPNRKQKVMRRTAIMPEGERFISVPRKMWLYIGRVNKAVTTNIARAFIKTKADINNDEYLVVEQLKTIGELNAFKIGVNVQFYEKLNSSEFRPDGTIVRRFNFRRKSVKFSGQQNWDYKSETNSNLESSTLNVNNPRTTSSQRDLLRNFQRVIKSFNKPSRFIDLLPECKWSSNKNS